MSKNFPKSFQHHRFYTQNVCVKYQTLTIQTEFSVKQRLDSNSIQYACVF